MLKSILAAGAAAAVTALAATAYVSLIALPAARQDERRVVALEASQRAMQLIKKGNRDEHELDDLSAADLCRELLGGLQPDGIGNGRGGLCDDDAGAGDSGLYQPER